MPVGMKCLTTAQMIFGVDMHRTIPPPLPVLPFAPHVVIWGVGWSQSQRIPGAFTNSKAASPDSGVTRPVKCCSGYAIGRAHDAGPHPGHIWPNLLLPLIMLGSGSKSEFASGTVRHANGNMAIAVGYAVNLNLNCWDFPCAPMPSGVVVAAACTVHAKFTIGDFLGGLYAMEVDMAITWFSGLIGAGITSGPSIARGLRSALQGGQGFLGTFARQFAPAFRTPMMTPRALATAFSEASLVEMPHVMGNLIGNLMGSAVSTGGLGSPLGYSSPWSVYGLGARNHDPNAWANSLGHRAVGESPPGSGGSR
jgi:hypothetical protein